MRHGIPDGNSLETLAFPFTQSPDDAQARVVG
jgi:hypothetical protein